MGAYDSPSRIYGNNAYSLLLLYRCKGAQHIWTWNGIQLDSGYSFCGCNFVLKLYISNIRSSCLTINQLFIGHRWLFELLGTWHTDYGNGVLRVVGS